MSIIGPEIVLPAKSQKEIDEEQRKKEYAEVARQMQELRDAPEVKAREVLEEIDTGELAIGDPEVAEVIELNRYQIILGQIALRREDLPPAIESHLQERIVKHSKTVIGLSTGEITLPSQAASFPERAHVNRLTQLRRFGRDIVDHMMLEGRFAQQFAED